MSTKDQLEAMRAEIESHVENLRQLRKDAVNADEAENVIMRYAEAIKDGGWLIGDLTYLIDAAEESWPEPDGLRYGDGNSIIPTNR